jgi:hypothetical protein
LRFEPFLDRIVVQRHCVASSRKVQNEDDLERFSLIVLGGPVGRIHGPVFGRRIHLVFARLRVWRSRRGKTHCCSKRTKCFHETMRRRLLHPRVSKKLFARQRAWWNLRAYQART